MSFFHHLIAKHYESIHDRRALWRYKLSPKDFEQLKNELNTTALNVDARDITLYFAEWWKRVYDGGTPSIKRVYESLPINFKVRIGQKEFYCLAKEGAKKLGIRWEKKENKLYFRTLLLQGGLPLYHIKLNKGKYQDFLFAVLDAQPESVDDFIFDPTITNLLPVGSQYDVVYENCFEIVKEILNDEKDNEYNSLLEEEDALKDLPEKLRIRKKELHEKRRIIKPKVHWIFNDEGDEPFIYLQLGFAKKYSADDLESVFGLETGHQSYQLYIDDHLICSFRRNLKGDYKTQGKKKGVKWNGEDSFPDVFIIYRNDEGDDQEKSIDDLIQVFPTLTQPSLWTPISETEWYLAKGNTIKNERAHLLLPKDWEVNKLKKGIELYDENLFQIEFEGEIVASKADESKRFLTGIESFEWTILSKDIKPNWLVTSNMVVVRRKPKILVYGEDDTSLKTKEYKVYAKARTPLGEWKELQNMTRFPVGCVDLKIEKDGVIARDVVYNIGDFNFEFKNQSLESADIVPKHNNSFEIRIEESHLFDVKVKNGTGFSNQQVVSSYQLILNTEHLKIPKSIPTRLKFNTQCSLYLKLKSPFTGIGIIDADGELLEDRSTINISNLMGMRVLKPTGKESSVTFQNSLRPYVSVSENINLDSKPLIEYKDKMERLFYLSDSMGFQNSVTFQLMVGKERVNYYIKSFTDTLSTDNQLDKKVRLENNKNDLDLYAIPLNCESKEVQPIFLDKLDDLGECYKIESGHQQFVVISAENEENRRLLPRFINTNPDYHGELPDERIERYHEELLKSDYSNDTWKEVLAYFKICVEQELAFSTFDQIRAIGRSSAVATKAFFFFCMNQEDPNSFIEQQILKLEQDVGFCFHWCRRIDWETGIRYAIDAIGDDYFKYIMGWVSKYFNENGLEELYAFVGGQPVSKCRILRSEIQKVRGKLGVRVLNELPSRIPHITDNYRIPIDRNNPVKLLIHAGIAVAEGIKGVNQKSLWENTELAEELRRNVQYVQYITPNFYKRIILHVLSK